MRPVIIIIHGEMGSGPTGGRIIKAKPEGFSFLFSNASPGPREADMYIHVSAELKYQQYA